ncbi:hypothetical protein ACJX0J_026928 [Zea mays]
MHLLAFLVFWCPTLQICFGEVVERILLVETHAYFLLYFIISILLDLRLFLIAYLEGNISNFHSTLSPYQVDESEGTDGEQVYVVTDGEQVYGLFFRFPLLGQMFDANTRSI